MDRLTYIDNLNVELGYIVDFENFDKAVDKLAEFENFMEERGFEDLDHLRRNLQIKRSSDDPDEPTLVQTQAVLIKQLEDQNDRLIMERDKAVTQLATLKNVKAKEVGEALSTVAKYLGDIISQKLDKATVLDLAKYCKETKKYLAVSKLENVLFIVDHICNSPDNELSEMVEQLRKYIRSEIAELEGEQNEHN